MKTILTRILDKVATPKPLWSKEAERQFKYCLTKNKVTAKVVNGIIHIRPTNCDTFKTYIDEHGLANDPTAQEAIKYLRENPAEYLKFKSDR